MSKIAEHLKWCRWCEYVKSPNSRIRHEKQAHSFEQEETKKMADKMRSKSFTAPSGYIWCTACHVIVENTVSGVSNHSNSMYHKSKSGRPLRVVSNSVRVVSKTADAAAPHLQISRRQPGVQERPEDENDGFEYGAHVQSGACLLFLYSFCFHSHSCTPFSYFFQILKSALEDLRALLIPTRKQKLPFLFIEQAQKM